MNFFQKLFKNCISFNLVILFNDFKTFFFIVFNFYFQEAFVFATVDSQNSMWRNLCNLLLKSIIGGICVSTCSFFTAFFVFIFIWVVNYNFLSFFGFFCFFNNRRNETWLLHKCSKFFSKVTVVTNFFCNNIFCTLNSFCYGLNTLFFVNKWSCEFFKSFAIGFLFHNQISKWFKPFCNRFGCSGLSLWFVWTINIFKLYKSLCCV